MAKSFMPLPNYICLAFQQHKSKHIEEQPGLQAVPSVYILPGTLSGDIHNNLVIQHAITLWASLVSPNGMHCKINILNSYHHLDAAEM